MNTRLLWLFCFTVLLACNKSTFSPSTLGSFFPDKEGPGNTVSIKGTFTGDLSKITVQFNGTIATVVSATDSLIIVTIPPGATTGPLIINTEKETLRSTAHFTVLKGTWKRMSNFPGEGRAEGITFVINGKAYFGTGFNGGTGLNDMWEYDPKADRWNRKSNLPTLGRWAGMVMVNNNKAYITGGLKVDLPDHLFKDVWEYDPVTDKWTAKKDFPGTPRSGGIAISVSSKSYLGFGGTDIPVVALRDWWEYDAANDQWTQKPQPPFGDQQFPNYGLTDNTAFIGNGRWGQDGEWWQFSALNEQWAKKTSIPHSPLQAASFTIGSLSYVLTGATNKCWSYDPATDTWTQVTSLPETRTAASGFSINGKGYLVGGSPMTSNDDAYHVWQFTPQ